MLDDNKKAKCKVCRKSFVLSNTGRGALISHQTKSEKHKHIMNNLSALLVQTKLKSPADNIQDFVSNKPDDISGETNAKNKQQAPLEVVAHNSEKL